MSARSSNRPGRGIACLAAVLLLWLCASAAAFGEDAGLRSPPARESALGGKHAALADDISTLFANPAGFRAAGPEFSLSELTVGMSGPVFDVANIVAQGLGGGGMEDIISSPEVSQLLQGLRAKVGLVGPVSFGYVGNGLGFGFFNDSEVEISSIGVVPTVSGAVRESVTLCGGYAFRIPLGSSGHYLDIGALLKAFVRGEVSMTRDLVGLLGVFQNPSMDIVLEGPFTLDVGAGIDVGIRYSWAERLTVGIVARDAYTPFLRNTYATTQSLLDGLAPSSRDYQLTPLDLSVGVGFRPALGRLDRVVTDLVILADYVDILDFVFQPATARNPVLHAGIGLEVVLLDVLALRGGFSQGLFAAGLGIDLSFFTLNLSMFGQELSTEPGLAPAYNLVLGLEFRL
jgi:hypothetical protein